MIARRDSSIRVTIVPPQAIFSKQCMSHPGTFALDRKKRCRRNLRIADTTHVGWKTEPVKDDQSIGLKTAVASRDGLAACRSRAREGLFAVTIRSTRRNLRRVSFRARTARDSWTVRLKATAGTERCQRPPQGATNGPQSSTSAGRRSIAFWGLSAAHPRQSETASHRSVSSGRRRADRRVF